MDPLNPPVLIGEAVAGQSAALRKRMRALAADLSANTFDLAEAFFQAQETRCFLEWGFESLGEYAAVELGIKHRKAQYLARIVKVCRKAGVPRKDYEQVGVTKLREITTLDPEATFWNAEEKKHEPMVEHIVDLIAEAPELTTVELELKVAHLKGMTGDNAMVMRSYKVTKSAWENVITRCFESIRKRLGSAGRDESGKAKEYSDGAVIEALCAEYNSDPRNFYEETDESRVQIEPPTEGEGDANLRSDISTGNGAPVSMDSEENSQDTFRNEQKPFVLPSETD